VPDHVPELVDYLNRAFDDLVTARLTDVSTVRLRVGAYLGAVYRFRNYRKAQLGKATGTKDGWEKLVRKRHVAGGQHVEAHLVVRGKLDHDMTKMELPALAPIYPSESLFPSDYLYPGQNLTWKQLNELDQPTRRAVSRADKDGYFKNLLAGLPILPIGDVARRCLLNWEGFGRLSDAAYMAGLRSAAHAP
jgi:hypothetical protein